MDSAALGANFHSLHKLSITQTHTSGNSSDFCCDCCYQFTICLMVVVVHIILNTFASGRNREFLYQNNRIARGFAQEFFWSGKQYRPGQRLKYAANLLVCTRKNFLLGGCRFCLSDVKSGGLLGHLGPLYLALGTNR